ncbi:MAG: MFS transporter [bacterium]|nr:MFS transporter [bacterium]
MMSDDGNDPQHSGIFYGWIVIGAIFVIVVLNAGISMSFGVFLNPLVDAFGWTRGNVSLAYSISMIFGGLCTLAVGGLLDRYSIRKIILWGGLIHAAGIMLTATTRELWQFYLFYGLLASMGRSTFNLSYVILVNRWFHEKRGIAMGSITSGQGMGRFLFSPFASYLIVSYSLKTAFFDIGAMMAIGIVLVCLFIRNSPEEMGLRPLGAPPEASGVKVTTPSKVPGQTRVSRDTGEIWGEIVRTESFWLLSLTHFFCCICHAIPLVHVAAFANVTGISALTSAWLLGTMGLMSFVGRLYWGFFADKHGSRFTLMLTTILQAVFMLWLINTADAIVFFLFAVFWGFGYAGVTMQYGIIARDVFPKHIISSAYAGVSCFAMVGMALGGYLGGALFDISHTYIISWWASLICGLIAALLAMDIARKAEQEKRTSLDATTLATETADGVSDHATGTML